ncbi:MAG: hypothetical protein QF473_19895, partial [Planctomycetota bacterium]|nr:hypothetical protein [Planctomycetota bacterium]
MLPDPFQHSSSPSIGPAPVPVVEQIFWLELDVPPESPAELGLPAGVCLLDRTKPGQGRTRTRFYLRSERGMCGEEVSIRIGSRQPHSIPLKVLTYREDIEEQIKEVPGIDPAVRKQGRSYYTDEMIDRAEANMRKHPSLSEKTMARTRYDGLSDEQLFQSLPSWNVPRQCYSNWPCPDCGEKIFETSTYYAWEYSDDLPPFKVACPLCKRLMPSNDYANDDFTSGEFPDDGWGWDDGTGDRNNFSGWVAYNNHRLVWEGLGPALEKLALRYLLFSDEEAAHRAVILLSRLAYVYPGMNLRWQQVRPDFLRPGRALIDGNWERKGMLVPACRAYDAIFEWMGKAQGAAEFIGTKDDAIQSPDDLKALIETYLTQLFGWDWIRRELSGGNMCAREADLADFAFCADMGHVSERWIEELFTRAHNSGADIGGFDDEVFVNTMHREGPVMIAGIGYATGYVNPRSDLAESLLRQASNRWEERCNLYDASLYPKFRAEFDTWIDFLVAGQFGPSYGDSGGGPGGAKYPAGLLSRMGRAYMRAWKHWKTDKLARAIQRLGEPRPELFEEDFWPEIKARAEAADAEPPLESRAMDGVGFVFLESRPQTENVDERAGIALRYGLSKGHHHQDNLNIEMFARGCSVAPELGYPGWAHPLGNTNHVAHHNTGMIDRAKQYEDAISRGTLELFAAAPEASFAEVSAEPGGFPNRTYRRAVCLADGPGGNVYMLDVLRLAGGTIRTCCFSGPPFDDFGSSIHKWLPGDPVGDPDSKEHLHLADDLNRGWEVNILGPENAADDEGVWADWKYLENDVRMRLTFLGNQGRRYIKARCGKPDIPPIRYFFAEEEAEDGASEFVSLWQPYEGQPFILDAVKLPVTGAAPGEFRPVAVQITLDGNQVDTFFYSQQPETLLQCGEFQFQGSFGYWSELNGALRAIHLVNGSRLTKGDIGIPDMPPPFQARINEVDYRHNRLRLSAPLPDDLEAKDMLIYIKGGKHRTAYHISEVLPARREIVLDHDALIYRSKLEEFGSDGRHVVCEIPPPFEASRGFKPGHYDGATLTGEGFEKKCRVIRVEENR